ncbi:hypothetical protein U9M48_006857 [Paspalum notatum var. saurae]|uniref:F-box domain-containing protein n=1 Tax=Paspalum notatum var. saurae TaxID=547442 RepID=A0AAQ3PQ16_PASNO
MEEGRRRRKFSELVDYSAGSSSRRLKINPPIDDDVQSCHAASSLEDLPVELLHMIVSRLTVKEAGRTSVLSSRWRKRWIYHSNLCFDGASSESELAGYGVDRFVDHVTTVLQRHSRVGVDRFELRSPALLGHAHHHLVDGWWLGFVASAKAKHVTLDLGPLTNKRPLTRVLMDSSSPETKYKLPWPSSSSITAPGISSIVSLLLGHMCLEDHKEELMMPAAAVSSRRFQSLKKLELRFVLNLGGLTPMLSSCPALEWLSICESRIGHLVVPEQARCLRYLRLQNVVVDNIQLNATSLTTFEYTATARGTHRHLPCEVPIKAHHAMKLSQATILVFFKYYHRDTLGYFWDQLSSCLAPVDRLVLSIAMDINTTSLAMNPTKFVHLKHLTLDCCILSFAEPKSPLVILRLTQILESAPLLQHFVLHMDSITPKLVETAGDECIRPHVHHCLKTVQMTDGVVRSDWEHSHFIGVKTSAEQYLDPHGEYRDRHVLKIVAPDPMAVALSKVILRVTDIDH